MSLEALLTNATAGVSQFWLGNIQRWKAARALGKAYKADNLAADMVGFWGDALDAWAGFLAFGPEPVVPTVFFSDAAAAFPGQTPSRSATLTYSVPSVAVPASTDLIRVGGGAPIPLGQVHVTVADTLVSVELQIPAGPAPAAGLYQGVAYLTPPVTTPPRILAEIIVLVT
jgi:hypothetical protein